MQLDFHRQFAAPASVVWTHLCDPEAMNRWSMAKVRIIETGQADHPGGPGTHRRVYLPLGGKHITLNEVIRDSQPGRRLVYQVVDAPALRSHLGTIALQESAGGTHLHWKVELDCLAPGGNQLIARILRKKLGASLDTLAAQLATLRDPVPLPSWQDVPAPSESEWREARHVLAALQGLAAELDATRDPKRVFPHIYSFVSEGILDACEEGRFVYPSWALRLLPVFYDYYHSNYLRWIGALPGSVESHWRRAFQVAERGTSRYPGPAGQLMSGLILSIHAHVESDLPRTMAEVYVDHFSKHCDFGRFRGDYYCMGQIFIDSAARIQALIPEEYIPLWAKAADRLLPEEVTQMLIYRQSYNLPKQRRAAFRRGAELAEMLKRRSGEKRAP